jgi:transposase-like protein
MAEYSDQMKAQALAALLSGQSFGQVASMLGVPIGTLKSWKQRSAITPNMDAPDASERRARIGALLLEYLQTTLETLGRQQLMVRDETWLHKQSAAEIAVLHRESLNGAIRLLEGLAETDSAAGADESA